MEKTALSLKFTLNRSNEKARLIWKVNENKTIGAPRHVYSRNNISSGLSGDTDEDNSWRPRGALLETHRTRGHEFNAV